MALAGRGGGSPWRIAIVGVAAAANGTPSGRGRVASDAALEPGEARDPTGLVDPAIVRRTAGVLGVSAVSFLVLGWQTHFSEPRRRRTPPEHPIERAKQAQIELERFREQRIPPEAVGIRRL